MPGRGRLGGQRVSTTWKAPSATAIRRVSSGNAADSRSASVKGGLKMMRPQPFRLFGSIGARVKSSVTSTFSRARDESAE